MNKYLLLTEAKPSVTTRLLQNNLHELKSIKVSVERKDVPQDVIAGSLARSLDNPEDLIIHRLGEGQKPIFDRNDVTVNLDAEEKIVIPTSELYTSVEQRSRYSTIEYLGTKPNSTPCEELGESEKKIKDCNKFPSKQETISIPSEIKPEDRKKAYSHKKEPRYQKSSERRNYHNDKYKSDEGVHRKPSSYGSYKYNQIRNTFDRDYFQRPQENTPHLKNADYHRRGRFPYFKKRYELPTWRERRGFRNRFPLAHFHPQERYNPHYQYRYCAPWLVYVPIQAVIPPPLPNSSQYVPMTRPRFSPRKLPVYNGRPRAQAKKPDFLIHIITKRTNVPATTSIADTVANVNVASECALENEIVESTENFVAANTSNDKANSLSTN